MTEKTTWAVLSRIDCAKHVEKKNNLTYLSWAWAWGITKENFPEASYRVISFDGKPYLHDPDLGYLVKTEVTISGETIEMHLPVMDGANKAQKNIPYTYQVSEYVQGKRTGKMLDKRVEAATMFDVNTAIMRCLTKNLAMFGLGHYIYAGEDLPMKEPEKDLSVMILECSSIDEITRLWNNLTPIQHSNGAIKAMFSARRKVIEGK